MGIRNGFDSQKCKPGYIQGFFNTGKLSQKLLLRD